MASTRLFSLLSVFTLSLLLTTTDASSRSLLPSHETTVLDVVSSLQQTQHILSLDPTLSSLTTTTTTIPGSDPVFLNSSSPLSLELHSRDTLVASQHKDYKSLVLSRLERDSSRVAGITTKIRFACLYQVSYGDGSFTVGDYATDTVTFGTNGKVNDVALGCGHDNEGLFTGAAGLLGLGGGALSMTNQIKATSFSYCLVDRDSGKSSSLDFNSVQAGTGDATAPLLRNSKIDTFYYVGLSGFSVGGQQVSIPSSVFAVDASGAGGVILDCGTAVTRLQTQAYNSLRDAFVKLTANLKKGTSSISLFDTCYDFSSLSTVKVPTVAFHFTGGKSIDLPAKNYLIPVDDAGTFCFAFAPTSSSLSIIGNVQQQGTRITYDLANNLIGLSANQC
ncbi:hypothetical protein HID58_043754 [Brassica napus]|uniref:Peptidase A1 domain-containing protein n=1 Tax=Brassica napus TaxID=3708 RepID=A0ABQ8BJ78_BRANA|nr:hypothetical protein HID58_043754 [Brassica napus]